MIHPLTRRIRACSRRRFCAEAGKLVSTLALLILISGVANAYTIVMRGGHRREIPDAFHVTQLTLTYEAAPGINITLLLANIDIAATERANGETPGSLLRRAAAVHQSDRATPAPPPSSRLRQEPRRARTLTNRDLESARRAREASEQEYERRRQELGLPSAEEMRRSDEAARAALREISRETEEQGARAESYWRARANELRTDIAALDAEINYLRARVAELSAPYSINDFAYITAFDRFSFISRTPLGQQWPRRGSHPHLSARQPAGMRPDPQLFGRNINGGGGAQGPIIARAPVAPGATHRLPGHQGRRPHAFPPVTNFVFGVPQNHLAAFSYDRSVLAARLYEAEAERAALQARWRILEEEARRAGALPGWLRP